MGKSNPTVRRAGQSMIIGVVIVDIAGIFFVFCVGGEVGTGVGHAENDVFHFVGDGIRNGGGGFVALQHHKSVVGFIQIFCVDGFGKSGKIAVFFKRGGLADVNGGKFAIRRAFRHKNHTAIRKIFIEFVRNGTDVFRIQSGIFHCHMINGQDLAIVRSQFAVKIKIYDLLHRRRSRRCDHDPAIKYHIFRHFIPLVFVTLFSEKRKNPCPSTHICLYGA